MSAFLEDAIGIFETALAGSQSASSDSDMAVLFDSRGGLRIVDSRDWSLGGLEAHYGARTVYRMHRDAGRVRVEARSGSQSCVLESETPRRAFLPGLSPAFPACVLPNRLLA